ARETANESIGRADFLGNYLSLEPAHGYTFVTRTNAAQRRGIGTFTKSDIYFGVRVLLLRFYATLPTARTESNGTWNDALGVQIYCRYYEAACVCLLLSQC